MSFTGKPLLKFLKFFFAIILVVGIFFSGWPENWNSLPQAQAVASGDGKIIYGENSTAEPRTRDWTGTFGAEGDTIIAAATIRHVIIKASPVRDEMIAGIQTTGGVLYVQRWNGSTWSNEWNVTVGDGNLPRFDIAYERTTGDAMVAYGGNVGTTNEIKYNIWNGSSWGGATNYDAVRTSGTVAAIALAAVGGSSNDFGMAWADSNLDLSANYWDGTNNVWKTEPSAALSTGIDTLAAAAAVTTWSFDLDFEASGELLIVWGNAAGTDILYRTRGAGQAGAWSGSNSTAAAFAEQSDDLELTADPNSDYMILVHTGSDSGADTEVGRWDGSAFPASIDTSLPCSAGTVCVIDITSDTTGAGTSGNAAAWLTDGANTFGVVTYDDTNAAGVDWVVYDKSADTWAAQTDCTTDCGSKPASGDDKSHRLRQNPLNDAEVMGIFVDTGSDLWVNKLTLSGTTLTWSQADGGTALETTVSSVTGFPVDFAYNRYIPPVTTLGDGTDPGNSTVAPGTSVTDLDAFTLTTNTGADTVTALTVTLVPASSFNNIAKVEITDGSNVDECTDIDNPSSLILNFTGCSLAVTTSPTSFKVRITPKTHANMPAVPGASYEVTGAVTAITATNLTAGTDFPPGFNALNATGAIKEWWGVSVNSSNGDVYALVVSGDIYKQTAGTGTWNALNATGAAKSWVGVSVNSSSGDVYATEFSGDIYKQQDATIITVDNASPAAVTSSTATAGDALVDLAWTNPADSDFTTGGTVVVLRRAGSAVADVPVEGTTYSVGNTIGTATVACVVTGSPPATSCQDTSLSNGTAYHYEIFTQDSRGNYDAGTVPTGSPATPTLPPPTLTVASSVNQPLYVAVSTSDIVLGTASLSLSEGSDSVTAVTLKENSGTIAADTELSNIELWLSSDQTWDAGDNQLSTAQSFNGTDGEATFTETFNIATATQYLIVRGDITSSADAGDTIEIQVKTVSTTALVSGTPLEIGGTSTV